MPEITHVRANWEWDQDAPLTQLVKAGDFLLLSGQIPYNEKGETIGVGDLKAQARQVFKNMQHVLGLVGVDLTSVVRLTNYIVPSMRDPQTTKDYWEVKQEFFGDKHPASTGIQVVGLMDPDWFLEVDAIAYAPHAKI
ncbi:RidA family protein [Paenarthrobacter sp. NPDC058040]|uniref:RidA family protein n=1 Tax=unclassified Paenarthrobacter TaxID=2634190 RepID=UPI0036DE23AA